MNFEHMQHYYFVKDERFTNIFYEEQGKISGCIFVSLSGYKAR